MIVAVFFIKAHGLIFLTHQIFYGEFINFCEIFTKNYLKCQCSR